jgi:hypothetical protein
VVVREDAREMTSLVCPDAYVLLRVEGEGGGTRVHPFVEVDRSTMTVKRYTNKLRGYWHYWRQSRATERYGCRNFLVLTITRSPQGAEQRNTA